MLVHFQVFLDIRAEVICKLAGQGGVSMYSQAITCTSTVGDIMQGFLRGLLPLFLV